MTAPPAGALEACLVLLEKATPGEWEFRDYVPDGPLSDAVHSSASCEGGGDIVCVDPMRDGYENSSAYWAANAELIATAVNLLRQHGPALLAALRLREGCEGLVAKHRERAQQNREAHDNSFEDEDRASFTGVADACDDCADDLARVLEQTK